MTKPTVRRRALAAAFLFTFTSTVGTTGVAQARPTDADGIWQTDGYNSIIAVSNGKAQVYDYTSVSCVESGSATEIRPGFFDEGDGGRFTIRTTGGRATIQFEGSVGIQHLVRRGAVPARCLTPGPSDPLAVFDVFWATFAENYPFFAAKGIDWRAERDRVRPLITPGISDDELFDLMAGMLAPLGDAHTGMRSETKKFSGLRPGTSRPSEVRDAADALVEQDLAGSRLTSYANGNIGYADLPGGIGYLRVLSFLGYTDAGDFAEDTVALGNALDAIFTRARVSRLKGLMIDVRVNGGGSDPLGLQIAARLTKKPYLAYFKQTRNDPGDATRFTAPQGIRVRPAGGPAYTGPIAMLTAGSTVSAGETFTEAMMARSPRPVRFGENTQGVFSDVMFRSLPNDWLVAVPSEEYRTPNWTTYDGPGIPPDHRIPALAPHDPAYRAALRFLNR